MLNSWYSVLGSESLTFTPPNITLSVMANLYFMSIKLFSRLLAWSCGQLEISLELEGVDFGAGYFFLS